MLLEGGTIRRSGRQGYFAAFLQRLEDASDNAARADQGAGQLCAGAGRRPAQVPKRLDARRVLAEFVDPFEAEDLAFHVRAFDLQLGDAFGPLHNLADHVDNAIAAVGDGDPSITPRPT